VARERVEATPLPVIAKSAEMSTRGLSDYLAGASAPPRTPTLTPLRTPRRGFPPTHESLFKWLRSVATFFPPPAKDCIAFLETVVLPLEPRVHGAASADLLDVLINAYDHATGCVPNWLSSLRGAVDSHPLPDALGEPPPPPGR
jgi:hypothetical protein